jgi:hypothetical protein
MAGCGRGENAGAEIRFEGSPEEERFGTIVVTGLADESLQDLRRANLDASQWADLLAVYTGDAPATDQPPVLGRYDIEYDVLRFTPRFPFEAGMSYHARFDGSLADSLSARSTRGTPMVELSFVMPEPEGQAATSVVAVYPSTDSVPENLLRVYVRFSAPMLRRDVHEHVHLYDSAGEQIPLPFVEIDQGLWDPTGRRLTLFLHPGRIKRGVAPNLQLGPPLREGHTFRLVVDRACRDATGTPLAASYEKELHVAAADRESPDYRDWVVSPPTTLEAPLVIDFGEPLDHALLQRFVVVEDSRGTAISGNVSVQNGETRWSLRPEGSWKPGDYTILVNPALEDLAGNTLLRLFDEEIGNRSSGPVSGPRPVRLRFSVS